MADEMADQSEMMKEEEVKMSDEMKEILDEMVKEAENWDENQDDDDVSKNVTAAVKLTGFLQNRTNGALQLTDEAIIGISYKRWPDPLPIILPISGDIQMESRESDPSPHHVAGMVLYKGKNRLGVPCAWLLAWSDSKTDDGFRISAECGRETKFEIVDWYGYIKPKLDRAGPIVYFFDVETGTSVTGKFLSTTGKVDRFVGLFAG